DDSTLPAWLTFDSTTQTFSGTPPLDYVGSLDVKVTASDGEYSVADTFALNIVGSNNAPVIATPLADQSSAEDTAVNFEIPVDAFSDVDGHALTLSATLSDGSSLPAWLSFDPSTRTFLGTPPLNFIGSLDVRVTASDGIDGVSDTFELTVTAVNDDPSAVDDSTNAENGGAVIVMVAASLLANDTDVENDTLSILSVQDAVQGSVALNANGDVEFTPNAGYFGSASFTYTVTDGTAQNTATVVLELQQPNGSPNVINGTGNADVIAGTSGDDMIEGGLGNDKSQGEDGSDTYVFNAGDGQDVIDDNGSNDTDKLVIHGYTPAETNFAKVAASTLIVTFNGSTDQITIVNTLSGGEDDQIEQIVFDDGTVMSMSDINAIISGQSPAPNSITGTIGSDSLTGTNSDETFDGDAGDDTLAGGYGHDTYLYGEGSGHDVINEHSASSAYDVLQLIGLNQSDVTFSRSMTDINDVIVTINSSGETVTLDNQQNYKDGVEKIVFADGSVLGSDDWSIDGLLYGMAPILGTDGDDTLSGANSDDIFDGGAGNDTIAGNYGHDTYLFGVGSGHDFVD
ncbi:MAG: tandem-95 repeat protein, partial [bacterium]|nr:tandem-95 repeat protein [bacterium]